MATRRAPRPQGERRPRRPRRRRRGQRRRPRPARPTSLADWEALWTRQRDAIVERIKDNGWGKSADGKTLTGPGGWTVDLGKCPAGWSDTEGVSDTSIKIAAIPLSGTYADYGNIGRGIEFLFGYYNDQGLFKGATSGKARKVQYSMKDGAHDADDSDRRRAARLREGLAVWTASPSTFKTYDKTSQRCVPQPFSMTAHPAWGDPVNHPWATGAVQLTYAMEAILWIAWIEQHLNEFPAGERIKVAALVQNNDYGKSYDQSFRAALQSSPALKDRVDYFNETIEASAPTVTDPVTNSAARGPDVWFSMLAGAQHADRDRSGSERDEGGGQVPVHAAGLRGVELHRQAWRRRHGRRRLVRREPGHQGHEGPGVQGRPVRHLVARDEGQGLGLDHADPGRRGQLRLPGGAGAGHRRAAPAVSPARTTCWPSAAST